MNYLKHRVLFLHCKYVYVICKKGRRGGKGGKKKVKNIVKKCGIIYGQRHIQFMYIFFIRNCRPSRDIFTIFNAKISSLKIEICKHYLKNIFGSKILYIKKKWINTVILIPKIQHNLFHFDFSLPKSRNSIYFLFISVSINMFTCLQTRVIIPR